MKSVLNRSLVLEFSRPAISHFGFIGLIFQERRTIPVPGYSQLKSALSSSACMAAFPGVAKFGSAGKESRASDTMVQHREASTTSYFALTV